MSISQVEKESPGELACSNKWFHPREQEEEKDSQECEERQGCRRRHGGGAELTKDIAELERQLAEQKEAEKIIMKVVLETPTEHPNDTHITTMLQRQLPVFQLCVVSRCRKYND